MLGKVGKLLTGTVRYGTVLKVDRAEGLKYLNCKKRTIEVKKRETKRDLFFSFPSALLFLSFLPDSFLPLSSGYHDIPTLGTYSTDLLFFY